VAERTTSVRLDSDLFEEAKLQGEHQDRSATQQIAHWVRLGRALEASRVTTFDEVQAVLAGRARYDTLDPRDQARVRAEWDRTTHPDPDGIDLRPLFRASGRTSWVEAGADGEPVTREE
jgi:hypothetical protein